jgi:hypothetical protein
MTNGASVPKTKPHRCWRLVLKLSPLVACSPAQEIPTNVASAQSAAPALAAETSPATTTRATTTQHASALPTCRSSADCQEGLVCCTDTLSDEDPSHCQPACAAHEACVPGGPSSCPGDLVCTALGQPTAGACLAATPSVDCGGLRCSGGTPGCCHSLATHAERCIAVTPGRDAPADTSCQPGPDNAAILCRSRSDCGGESCCTHGFYPVTSCETSCASGIDVCLSVADCPDFIGPPIGCAPDPDLAFGIKVCQYAVPE